MKHNSNSHILIITIFIVVTLWSCGNSPKKIKVVFEEKAGISRNLEYVKVTLANHNDKVLLLKEVLSGDLLVGEKLDQPTAPKDSSSYIFPISIKANEKKIYHIAMADEELEPSKKLNVTGSGVSLKIENEHFIADFTSTDEKAERGLYPGQLTGILIKNKGVLYKRGENNMHWAPNFQKEGQDYKTIGHLNLKNAKVTQSNSYLLEMSKFGHVVNYEEIDVFGQYNFYAGLPYFVYKSKMTFNRDTELVLLRNDEITMDSLFTHLIYPEVSGTVAQMPLYGTTKFDSLTRAPLNDDIKWVGFINKPKGYGLLSIRLEYDNRNLEGNESPLYQPHTKISSGRDNGRYWNRRLIHEHSTFVPKGSSYYERNAYFVIDNLDKIDSQINYYVKSLSNPIVVSSSSE